MNIMELHGAIKELRGWANMSNKLIMDNISYKGLISLGNGKYGITDSIMKKRSYSNI